MSGVHHAFDKVAESLDDLLVALAPHLTPEVGNAVNRYLESVSSAIEELKNPDPDAESWYQKQVEEIAILERDRDNALRDRDAVLIVLLNTGDIHLTGDMLTQAVAARDELTALRIQHDRDVAVVEAAIPVEKFIYDWCRERHIPEPLEAHQLSVALGGREEWSE